MADYCRLGDISDMRLRIREYRKKKRASQEDLAGVLGTTQATISRYETGEQWPGADVFDALAEYFGCAASELIDPGDLDPDMKASDVTPEWLRAMLARYGVKQNAVAEYLGLSDQSIVSKMVNSQRAITANEADRLIEFFRDRDLVDHPAQDTMSPNLDITPTVESTDNSVHRREFFIGIPRYKIQLSGGYGREIIKQPPQGQVPFTLEFIQSRLGRNDTDGLVMFDVVGNSMRPAISSGDMVMVDMAETAAIGDIMAFRFKGDGFIKRLTHTAEGFHVVSDNRATNDPYTIGNDQTDDFEILGRVCWVGRVV